MSRPPRSPSGGGRRNGGNAGKGPGRSGRSGTGPPAGMWPGGGGSSGGGGGTFKQSGGCGLVLAPVIGLLALLVALAGWWLS